MNDQQLKVYRGIQGIYARASYLVQIHEAPDFGSAVAQINRARSAQVRVRRAAALAQATMQAKSRERAVSLSNL